MKIDIGPAPLTHPRQNEHVDAEPFGPFEMAFEDLGVVAAVGRVVEADPVLRREAGIAPPFAVHGSWEERIVDELAPLPGEPVLRDVNLVVEPGEFVALVGWSGAGKSRLVDLIQGFHYAQ